MASFDFISVVTDGMSDSAMIILRTKVLECLLGRAWGRNSILGSKLRKNFRDKR